MSQTFSGNPLAVNATGLSLTTSGTSASGAIPVDGSGGVPRYIRVAATVACYFRLGKTAATAVATDMLIQPGDAVILATNGRDFAAAIQVTAAGVCNITPLDNS